MDQLLKKVKDIYTEGCVSIILNTHRTKPDNEQDSINLKNLVKEAENRLLSDYEKRFVWGIMENLNKVVDQIDHNYNLESMVIFANSDFADFTRLPISVEARVAIDDTFATRDLVRALHQEAAYYVLVLSRQKARLIEAFNGSVVKELKREFPIDNGYYTTDKLKSTTQKGQDNLIEEFFNVVDKKVQEATQHHPLPIILATETRNFDHYLKMADKKETIIGHINKNRDEEEAHHIVADAWGEVLKIQKEKQEHRISELQKAVSSGKFLSDFNDIWKAIQEGRGQTIFVKKGFFQPALLEGNEIKLVAQHQRDDKGIVDDIIDEMIEQNMAFGGDAVFISGNELDSFDQVALVTRY